MNYKLINNSLNDVSNPKKTILLNRGIEDWKNYLQLSESCVNDYHLLENINEAVECLKKHLEEENRIHIIVDSDVDGYTSASMTYRYLKDINWALDITYSLHTKKQHGLSDDVEIPEDVKLLIIPDAGSNDVEQCKQLSEKGVDIIILDHHIMDRKNDYAIVVNCQDDSYPNKNFCGAGVVYKFLQALDEELWESYADNYLDMLALGNISDVMDMREFETRYLVEKGLNNIKSKVFKTLIEKQSYSMKDIVNITNIQFYCTPLLNAMIRVGNQDDKELLFKAFIETDEIFKYKKRGETEEVDEDIYTRAARLCANAKSRQGKEVDKGVEKIKEMIETTSISDDKIMFINVSDILNDTLTGLCAIKLAEKYNKPCVLLRRQKIREDGGMYYGGSCRNFDYSPVDSLKEFLCDTNLFEFVQGHDNAAGVSISRDNVKNAIEECNLRLKDVDFTKCYRVDFEIDAEDFDISFIREIDSMKDLFGQGVKEPIVCIKNVKLSLDDLLLMGKEMDSWKSIDEDMAYVKFKVDKNKDEIIKLYESDFEEGTIVTIDVIGTVSINNYNNILTPQVVVKDYEVVG